MSILFVGDVHAKAEDLKDCEALHRLILDTVDSHKPDVVVYLGDQYHNHSVVNVEVQKFWISAFNEVVRKTRVFALVGNHDKPGDRLSEATAMQVHSEQIRVISEPVELDNILFVPYFHDTKELIRAAAEYPESNVLVCHQTFDGAKYENGFYAKEALDPNLLHHSTIISGHIHSPMELGKVIYPGSPRWQTISDANTDRSLWLVDIMPDGRLENSIHIPTNNVLRAIWQITEVAEESGPSTEMLLSARKPGDLFVVNLQGPQAWCEQRKLALAGLRPCIRFRTFPSDKKSSQVHESEGVGVAFKKHFDSYRPKNSTSKEVLAKMVEERVHV